MLAIIPLVILLVGGFMRLLARPIGELDRAIRELGDGRLEAEAQVRGPRLCYRLGERSYLPRCVKPAIHCRLNTSVLRNLRDGLHPTKDLRDGAVGIRVGLCSRIECCRADLCRRS